jgi:hypothetical protein
MAVDRAFDTGYGRGAGFPGMLAANADRERAIDVLRAGFAEGRLTRAEYDDRTARVYAARTYGELAGLTADLPGGPLSGPAHYPNAGYPPQQVARPAINSMAVAALVCGIGEFFTMGLTAVPAIVLGHAARRQLRRTGQSGEGMALAGLILGWTGLALLAAAVAGLLIVAGHSAQPAVDPAVVVHPAVVLPAVILPFISPTSVKPG